MKNEVEEVVTRNREEYEETNGTVTQENESQSRTQPVVRLLAQDSVLKLVSGNFEGICYYGLRWVEDSRK